MYRQLLKSATTLFLLLVMSLTLAACNPLANKAKAGLQVMTNEIPASLFLDGQYLDKSPYISKEIQPGTYSLRIQPDDSKLASYETTITLEKGLLGVVVWRPGDRPETSGGVIFEMSKLADRKRTELVVSSIPDGAIIAVDDRSKEFAPVTYTDLPPGQHEITISLPSYEAIKHTVNLVEGHRVTVTVKLAKTTAELGPITTTSLTASGSATASTSAITNVSSASSKTAPASARTASAAAQTTGPKVKIKPTGYKVNGQEVLRVRESPSNSGAEIGVVPVNTLYPYTGKTTDGWHNLEFNGESGWVSGQYAEIIR